MKRKVFLLLALVSNSFCLIAQVSDPFEQGNNAYNKGKYNEAIEYYQEVLDQQLHSPALYFNLANAYYKLGHVAESVFYFEKARLLDPKDLEIRNNIRFAKNMTLDSIEELPKTQLQTIRDYCLGMLSLTQWSKLVILLAWLCAFSFIGYRLSRSITMKRLLFGLGFFLFLIFGLGIVLMEQKKSLSQIKKAIVFSEEVSVWSEPNNRADVLFLLHEGTSLEVVDQLEGWSKIMLANGSQGWIEISAIKLLN